MKSWPGILLLILGGTILLLFSVGYYYYVPEIPPEVLNEKYNVEPDHYLSLNGMDVHYRVAGPASDTLPLVLLHGTFSSLYTWNGWNEALKERHRIIRLDLPGFGLTGPHPEEDYRLETYREFLASFLTEIGVEKCILAGNSLGGEIAWRYALHHPDQVEKLILIGAAGYPVDISNLPLSNLPLPYIWLRIPLIRELSINFTTRGVVRNSLEYLYGDSDRVSDELVELYFNMTNREGNREALIGRMENFGRPSPLEKIPTIQTPTLVMWGGKDRLIPQKNAWNFHQDLPKSELVIFPEAGHMPMEEIPIKSVEAVKEFINDP